MWLKAAACVLIAAATAMSLLALRQRRIDQMHQMATYHRQMRQASQSLWELQVEIADQLRPERLRQSVAQAGLKLEPVVTLEGVQANHSSHHRLASARRASEPVDVRE
jgi:cell division protein FtsL